MALQRQLLFVLAVACLILSVQGTSHGQRDRKIYWTEWDPQTKTGKVRRAHLDGTYRKDIVIGLKEPGAIALDPLRRKVYWIDHGTGKIQRADFTGRNIEDLVTGFRMGEGGNGNLQIVCDKNGCKGDAFPHKGGKIEVPHELLIDPYGLALDPGKRKMYWGNDLRGTIQAAALNGSNIQDILDIGIYIPQNFAIKIADTKIYWIDIDRKVRRGMIQRANLDGSDAEDIVTGLRGPHSIALDRIRQKIYWTADTSKIQRADLDGSGVEDVITGLTDVSALAVDPLAGKVYWVSQEVDPDVSKIQRANLDGSRMRDVIGGLKYVNEIALQIPGAYAVSPNAHTFITTWAKIK